MTPEAIIRVVLEGDGPPLVDRLQIAVAQLLEHAPSQCWIWTRALDSGGYGAIMLPGRRRERVHRIAFQWWRGLIPDGLTLDHLCRERRCFNPHHLEPVTLAENVKRGGETLVTHCPKGHEYSTENTHWYRGRRFCCTCGRRKPRANTTQPQPRMPAVRE